MKLKNQIYQKLSIKEDEYKLFDLLIFRSFITGIIVSFFFIPANTLFISTFGIEKLPLAYLFSGILGYIYSWLFNYFQEKNSLKKVINVNLIFLVVLFSFFLFLQLLVNENILCFVIFCFASPVLTITSITSDTIASKFYNLRQIKRLFGYINTGNVISTLISSLIISLTVNQIGNSINFIIVSIIACIASIFITLKIFSFKTDDFKKQNSIKQVKLKSIDIFKNNYFRIIFISFILTVGLALIVDFSYLSTIKIYQNLTGNENFISVYFSIIFSITNLGEFFISFSSNRILSKKGIKFGLNFGSIVSIVLITSATITSFIFGNETLLFLIIITTLKLADRIIRKGLGNVANNVLFQPLKDDEKTGIQIRAGNFQQIGFIAVAIILWILLNSINRFGNSYFNYFYLAFIPVFVLSLLISNKLYNKYKQKLKQILSEINLDEKSENLIRKNIYSDEYLKKNIKKMNSKTLDFAVDLVLTSSPKIIENYAKLIFEKLSEFNLKRIIQKIDFTWKSNASNLIKKISKSDISLEIKNIARLKNEYLEKYENASEINTVETEFPYNFNKLNLKEKEKIILKNLPTENDRLFTAIYSISSTNNKTIIENLINLLENKKSFVIASEAIILIGDKCLPYLEKFFENHETNIELLKKITEICAKIATDTAKQFLVKYFEYPDRNVQLSIIKALSYCKFQAKHSNIEIIENKIENTVKNILWLMQTLNDISEQKNLLKLYLALDKEKDDNYLMLFTLLGLIYNPNIINLIHKNIQGDNTIFAIEIIENYIDKNLNKLVIPIFDDISDTQKIKKLSKFFPVENLNFTERIKSVIKANFINTDLWSVCQAIDSLGKMYKSKKNKSDFVNNDYSDIEVWKKEEVLNKLEILRKTDLPDEIFLCMFHNDELIYSAAAKILYKDNAIICKRMLSNMNDNKKLLLKKLENNDILISDKINFLKRNLIFYGIDENLLAGLSKIFILKRYQKNDFLKLEQDADNEIVVIVFSGKIKTESAENILFYSGDILLKGFNIYEDNLNFVSDEETITLEALKSDFYNYLFNNEEILAKIIENISEYFNPGLNN